LLLSSRVGFAASIAPIRDAELEGSTLKSRLGPALKKRKAAVADLRGMLMAAEAKTVKK
jgi:hypothetical protein